MADILSPAPFGSVSIRGYLGDKMDRCIHQGIMAADTARYALPFLQKTDDGGGWGGEFWGKWMTSAALAYRYQPTDHHREILASAVTELLAAQETDGRLSSCQQDFADWDVWGRKYAMLGLIAYHDQTGDKRALDAAAGVADSLMAVTGPDGRKLTETGLSILEGLSSCSVLEPIALLFERTGDNRYQTYAEHLVSLWSQPNHYTEKGIRLVEEALAKTPPVDISSAKGYEMMSCFEGLCEMYRAAGDSKHLAAAVSFAESILSRELMIVGSGSSGELWCDGKYRQTILLEQPMETCVTATWMKLCYQLLRLTGESRWADEMEISLCNGLLGAMMEEGDWWAYFSPLAGERVPSAMQVPLVRSSCCVVNGPRALMTVPAWSVMTDADGFIVNLYAEGDWNVFLRDGQVVHLAQDTQYPVEGTVILSVRQDCPAAYAIGLRIPSWSTCTKISVNGMPWACTAGTHARIHRVWQSGDRIDLELDMRGRLISAPGSRSDFAIMRGPIVLAMDNRFIKESPESLWPMVPTLTWTSNEDFGVTYCRPVKVDDRESNIELHPVACALPGIWMAFDVPFFTRPTHFVGHRKTSMVFCDYASAGNAFSSGNMFRVWLSQPMWMGAAFPRDTWRLLSDKEDRPRHPDEETPTVLEH